MARGVRRVRRQHQFGASAAASSNPEDAWTINQRARELGFSTSLGIIHDGAGLLKPLGGAERTVFDEVTAIIKGLADAQEPVLGHPRVPGQPRRRQAERRGTAAPARAISTSASTASCTAARSSAATPGTPLEQYTVEDIRREFMTPKWCAPYCTIGCVHRVSTMDYWRKPQSRRPGMTAKLALVRLHRRGRVGCRDRWASVKVVAKRAPGRRARNPSIRSALIDTAPS